MLGLNARSERGWGRGFPGLQIETWGTRPGKYYT
jgi:hypothetical protein